MSIPGMSAAMLGVGAGVGSLPDMSIPGMFIPPWAAHPTISPVIA
jgi:hypothetical protein